GVDCGNHREGIYLRRVATRPGLSDPKLHCAWDSAFSDFFCLPARLAQAFQENRGAARHMKLFLLAISTVAIAAVTYDPAIPYFHQTRSVTVTATDKQNYAVLDADVFEHSRPDLADVRILDGQSQVPFVLVKQSGGTDTKEAQAKILNLGSSGAHTE